MYLFTYRSRRERLSKAARLGFGPLVDLGIVAARGSEEDTDRTGGGKIITQQ